MARALVLMSLVVMRVSFAALALSAAGGAMATALPPELRESLVQHGVPSCVAQQQHDSLAKYLTESQFREYCECALNRAADSLSEEYIGKYLQTSDLDVLRPRLQTAANACLRDLWAKWGYAK